VVKNEWSCTSTPICLNDVDTTWHWKTGHNWYSKIWVFYNRCFLILKLFWPTVFNSVPPFFHFNAKIPGWLTSLQPSPHKPKKFYIRNSTPHPHHYHQTQVKISYPLGDTMKQNLTLFIEFCNLPGLIWSCLSHETSFTGYFMWFVLCSLLSVYLNMLILTCHCNSDILKGLSSHDHILIFWNSSWVIKSR